MARPPFSLKRSMLFSTVAAFSLLGTVSAQSTTASGSTDLPALTTSETLTGNTDQTTATTQATTTQAATGSTGASASASTSASSSTDSVPAITGTSTAASDSAGDLPTLPTSSGAYSYPAPTVPPTQNAPFMQTSNLPQGTVFIAVGAILGAFGLGVLIWRAVVACMLHRSVKKAALAQHLANDKAAFPAPPGPFYKYTDRESTASLGNLTAGRGVRRTQRGPVPSATPSQTNLFFSPTAPGSMNNTGNRDSRLLPSGFYAAGSSAPGAQHGQSISMTNLRPDSRGHPRPPGHTPPESPNYGPRGNLQQRNLSTSTLNLNRPTSQRAPSAYLEDLLDDNPGQFPPPAGFNQPGGRI